MEIAFGLVLAFDGGGEAGAAFFGFAFGLGAGGGFGFQRFDGGGEFGFEFASFLVAEGGDAFFFGGECGFEFGVATDGFRLAGVGFGYVAFGFFAGFAFSGEALLLFGDEAVSLFLFAGGLFGGEAEGFGFAFGGEESFAFFGFETLVFGLAFGGEFLLFRLVEMALDEEAGAAENEKENGGENRGFHMDARESGLVSTAGKRVGSGKTVFVVFVSEFADERVFLRFGVEAVDVGEADAVEGGCLHHGVVSHVVKDELGTFGERFREGVIADDVAGEAGAAAETVDVRKIAGFARAFDDWAVGHFEDVGHVGGGGSVEDGDFGFVVKNIENGGDEVTGAEGDRFAGFEVDLGVRVAGLETGDEAAETFDVVIGTGDVVAAAEVDPFHLAEVGCEFFLHDGEDAFEGIGILLAEGVEMEAVDSVEGFVGELGGGNSEAGAGGAGVIDVGGDFGVFGVDAEAAGDGAGGILDGGAEFFPLGEGIENDVVGDGEDFAEIFFGIGGGADVDFAAEFLAGEPGFVDGAGGGAGEILADLRREAPHGESFERENDFGTGALLDAVEDSQVSLDENLVDDVAGRFNLGEVDFHSDYLQRSFNHEWTLIDTNG